jgi:hypothetical protein
MRPQIFAALALGASLVSACAAHAQDNRPQRVEAISTERFAAEATFRGLTAGQGYSDQTRRMTDCLVSDRRYDPRIDRIRVAPGVTRRCSL